MAYAVSSTFKTKIKDETIPKSCLILFDDLFFSTEDIKDSGAEFSQYFNTSADLTYGDCPSDTLSFSVVSNGNLAGYGFGKCRAFLGVQTATASYAFGDINAHIEVGGNIYTASESGLYRNSTKIDNGVYVSLVSDGTTVYAVGTSSSVSVNNASGTVSAYTPNRFMAQKLQSGLSAVFASNTAYVWDGENVLTYEYVPMGVYNVNKPRSSVGDVVMIQDAYDNMALFDRDAAEFINGLTYPRTLSQIYTALCDYVGVSYASSTFTYSTTNYPSSPFPDTQCTCRDILWWIAERARRVARFNRTGVLELRSISTTTQETLTANDIGQNGYSIAEYATPAVTGVLLRGSSGNSLTFGTLDTAYVISANPFVNTISVSDLQAYMAIPTYVPIELYVLEADPSIDVGDFVSIKPMVESVKVLTNVYNEIYTNANNEAYAIGSPTYAVPIMGSTVIFNGGIRAEYTATGNENREADLDNTEYNADVAAKMAVDKATEYADEVDESFTQQKVFNRLTNNGQAQGIFLDNNGDLYINGTYIQAHTVAVNRLTGTVANGDWGINFNTGVMSIGTLEVGSIKGNITGSDNWGINFTNGTMSIGNISATKITADTISPDRIAANSLVIGKLTNEARESLVTGTTVKNQYYLSTSSSSATGGSWADTVPTWSSGKYVWVRVATTKTYSYGSSSTTYSTEVYDKNLTTALSTAAAAQSTANGNIASTVSVYYRSTTQTTPTISTSTSIGTSATTDNAWEYVMPRPKNGTYFYTCERYTSASGTVTFSTVRQMSNLTYTSLWCSANDATCIDGASIYAGSVTTAALEAGAVTAEKISVSNLQAISASIAGWTLSNTMFTKNTADGTTEGHVQYQGLINAPSNPTASNSYLCLRKHTYTSGAYGAWENVFRVSYDGSITATKGTISGWNISASSLYKDSPAGTSGVATTQGRAYLYTPETLTPTTTAFGVQIREWDGSSYGSWKYPFGVRYNGELYATKAVITGDITANSLSLASGITIGGGHIGTGISGSNITTGTIAAARISTDLLRTSDLYSTVANLSAVEMKYLNLVNGIRFQAVNGNTDTAKIWTGSTSYIPKWKTISPASSTTSALYAAINGLVVLSNA